MSETEMDYEVRYPKTIEEGLRDCTEAQVNPLVKVVPTNELMVDMLTLLAKLKHS